MDCIFKWNIYASKDTRKVIEETISIYFNNPPAQLNPCHDEPLNITMMTMDPIDEEIYGVIRCSCDDYIGDLYCTIDGKNLDVILKNDP